MIASIVHINNQLYTLMKKTSKDKASKKANAGTKASAGANTGAKASANATVYAEGTVHKPVMLAEVIEGLNIKADGFYIDATFGRGGHTKAILSKLNASGRLWVLDKDPEAIKVAHEMAKHDPRLTVWQGSFANLLHYCKQSNLLGKINGLLLDLGVSSPQLETESRGFSFIKDGPLDMRMDPNHGVSAAEWINSAKEADIAEVFKVYGEERFYRRIAHSIVSIREQTPILSTLQLANIIAKANPAWEKHKNPATRCFQAIRIFINQELEELKLVLDQSLEILAEQGRLVVISFHSLEDRLVKQFIQKQERGEPHPSKLPVIGMIKNRTLRHVAAKIKPTDKELADNVRARSAILRISERTYEKDKKDKHYD